MGPSKMVMNLTLSAYRAEPPLGPSLPSAHSLSLGKLSLGHGSWAIFLGRRRLCVLRIVLIVLRSWGRFRFGVGDGTSSTKLNHVDGTVATRNQMTARQENNLTRGGKTDETLGCGFIFRRLRNRRIGMSSISRRLGRLGALGG